MRLALGFNRSFVDNMNLLPKNLKLIELGILEYNLIKNKNIKIPELSLHFSSSHITSADKKIRKEFIKSLKFIGEDSRIISSGFHLTGEKYEGIGQFGFSSHYAPSLKLESNAVESLLGIQDFTQKPTWIENANFYSASFNDIQQTYESLNKVASDSGSDIILDLSHLIIESVNNDLDPSIFIGIVDWNKVIEIHLSGIIQDKNGVLHDGHSVRVADKAWGLLKTIKPLLKKDTYINIEHVDPILDIKKDILQDIEILNSIINVESKPKKKMQPEKYAISYMTKLMRKWIPDVEDALKEEDAELKNEVEEWMAYCQKNNMKITLTEETVLAVEKNYVESAPNSFLKYIQDKY